MWASASAPISSGSGGGGDNSPTSTGARRRSRAAALRSLSKVRHECREGDDVAPFGFDRHDGRNYARQHLTDIRAGVRFTTHFAKPTTATGGAALFGGGEGLSSTSFDAPPPLPGRGGVALDDIEWVARIAGFSSPKKVTVNDEPGKRQQQKVLSLVVYVGFDCDGVASPCISLGGGGDASALEVAEVDGGG